MRASDEAYEFLREEIVGWRLLPGTPLNETELAERLGISRTPLRAALSRLALEGLVDTTRGRTGVVSDMSEETIRELFELRDVLETNAARIAAQRGEPAVFSELARQFGEAADHLTNDEGVDAYYDVVARFDEAIDDAVGNSVYRGALRNVRLHLTRARRIASDNAARLLRSAEEHRMICDAISNGDEAVAASATTLHLRASLATILATLRARALQEGSA